MAKEIERKFLVTDSTWKTKSKKPMEIVQDIIGNQKCWVRIRLAGNKAFLTVKNRSVGKVKSIVRDEFEYAIPLMDAADMIKKFSLGFSIEKTRWHFQCGKHTWEIDEFHGRNFGLVVAEIELSSERETFDLPPFIGKEVTFDKRYSNVNLAKKPFRTWKKRSRK